MGQSFFGYFFGFAQSISDISDIGIIPGDIMGHKPIDIRDILGYLGYNDP